MSFWINAKHSEVWKLCHCLAWLCPELHSSRYPLSPTDWIPSLASAFLGICDPFLSQPFPGSPSATPQAVTSSTGTGCDHLEPLYVPQLAHVGNSGTGKHPVFSFTPWSETTASRVTQKHLRQETLSSSYVPPPVPSFCQTISTGSGPRSTGSPAPCPSVGATSELHMSLAPLLQKQKHLVFQTFQRPILQEI